MPRPSPVAFRWLLVCCLGCGASAPSRTAPGRAPPGDPRLVVISSLIGYIEPCGCTVDLHLGGIDRIVSLVKAQRREGPTAVLVVGPHLFESAQIAPSMAAQAEAKARLLARTFARLGVDAAVPTSVELARGPERLAELRAIWEAPDPTVNVAGGAGRMLALGALKIGVVGVVDPTAGPVPAGQPIDPLEATRREVARLRARGAQVVVALAALPRRALRGLAAEVEGVDLWVLGIDPMEAPTASPVGRQSYLLEAGDRGRHLGVAVLHAATRPGPLADPVGAQARARRSLELRIEMRRAMQRRTGASDLGAVEALLAQRAALDAQVPDRGGKHLEWTLLPVRGSVKRDSEVRAWVQAYEDELARAAETVERAVPIREGGAGYVGGEACLECHEEAFETWRQTPHAKAWQTLVDAGKTFDRGCVSCHVTGWQAPGGAVMGRLDRLTSIGCEACHGPGSRHLADEGASAEAIIGRPTAPVCARCHTRHHSPGFRFATYVDRVLGPGHGRPSR